MAVIRVDRTGDFTVMANHHLRNRALSLKAKGLLSLMLSLPDDWSYTVKGLAEICRDGVDSIRAAVHELEGLLGIRGLNRMEAYDISNINGFETVGSMVVYEKGKPKRSDYRKFKLRTITGPDDYGSMYEVLTRRFVHGMEEKRERSDKGLDEEYGSFTRFPDIILMDGGRGQVNVCLRVLDELGLQIPVCGMVKDDFHRTRGLYFQNVEIPIDRHGAAFMLITRIQDEAHRFAIEYHRSLRSKSQVRSVLDDIAGIGSARRKALMRRFQSLEGIKNASLEELMSTESMNPAAAEAVYAFFHEA